MDFGRFDGSSLVRTPQGGLRIPANLTRVGVFTYRNPDGTERRELRPADEVFKADAIATLDDAPITDLHPAEMVSSSNHSTLAKGHVREVKRDGNFVSATLVVQDEATVKAIESGARREISCGYTCREDMRPGVFNGERYDLIQRDIRYNHAAIGPRDWGRAGSEVSMRIDSNDAAVQVRTDADDRPSKRDVETPMKIKIDGKEYEVGTQECFEALARLQSRADAGDAAKVALTAAEAKLVTEKARADAAEALRDAHKSKLDQASDPKALDLLVAARAGLLAAGSKILGATVKLDGKSDLEIKTAVVAKSFPKVKLDGRSPEAIDALYVAAVEAEPTPFEQSRTALTGVLHTDGTVPPAVKPVIPQWQQNHGVQLP